MRKQAALGVAGVFVAHFALAQSAGSNQPGAADTTAPSGTATGTGTVLPQVNVISASPLLGSGMDRAVVPAQNQVFTSKDLSLTGPADALQALQNQAQGVNLDNSAGNPFQPSVTYHGFQASPLQGTAQGLAVYVNGVRFNDPFGDTVNWDLIPNVAIDQINLEGANPVFGLNALGGALSVQLKNGFTYHGGQVQVFGGSFGQIGGSFEYGKQSGNVAAYLAVSGEHENGWRDYQQSGLKQAYGDIGWRGPNAEVHVNIDVAETSLNGPGTSPVQLIEADPAAQFTGPNLITNKYARVTANGNYYVDDNTSVQVVAYYDNLSQKVVNGNGSPLDTCDDGSGLMCESPGMPATTLGGVPIPAFEGDDATYGSIAYQTTNTNGYGASAQVTNTSPIFGLNNHFVAGFSFDGAQTEFSATTVLTGFDTATRNSVGPEVVIDLADGSIAPVRAAISNAYYGAYFTDTLSLTSRLAATLSGRFNAENIDINDQMGGSLTGSHDYTHFNPGAGLTYKLWPNVSLYGGYSISNRAPTPAELTCANAAAPCSLANFFVGDPDLQQPIAHAIEFGLRGTSKPFANGNLSWNVGAFRTDTSNDILFAQSVVLGTGYFQNVGTTRRQGVDIGARLTTPRWLVWASYSYTDATFQNGFVESSPNNPAADANGTITIVPGDRLPGIPANLIKIGAQYKVTDKWTVGATAIGATTQYLFGDEANVTKPLPGYVVVNLNTSYQITPRVKLFALLDNAFDERYYTYGTFSPANSVPIEQVPNATNNRAYNIAAPIAAFGGVTVTF